MVLTHIILGDPQDAAALGSWQPPSSSPAQEEGRDGEAMGQTDRDSSPMVLKLPNAAAI